MARESTTAKAQRLLAEGRVKPAPVAVYRVSGDHGTYVTFLEGDDSYCTCPARVRCSHIEAARMYSVLGAVAA